MPGHIKLGASEGPDPDPMPYLTVSAEMRRKDMAKPYDPKRAVWTPDGLGGYVEGLVQVDDGDKATVLLGHEVTTSLRHLLSFVKKYLMLCIVLITYGVHIYSI